jgi:hypothetical protein
MDKKGGREVLRKVEIRSENLFVRKWNIGNIEYKMSRVIIVGI